MVTDLDICKWVLERKPNRELQKDLDNLIEFRKAVDAGVDFDDPKENFEQVLVKSVFFQNLRNYMKQAKGDERLRIYEEVLELIDTSIRYWEWATRFSGDEILSREYFINVLDKIFNLSNEERKSLDNKTKKIIMENTEELAKTTDDNLLDGFKIKIDQLDSDIDKYIFWFILSLILDILAILGIVIVNYSLFKGSMDFWQLFARGSLLSVSILPLLIWLTKFFNRRLHESVHLKEDYEHRSLVLKSFSAYRQRLLDIADRTDDYRQLAHFIERVNTCITENPAESLNRKKGDRLPISEISELINAIQPLKIETPKVNNQSS